MRTIWIISLGLAACSGEKESSSEATPAEERWEGQYAGECTDEADNDGDGLFDCDDSDCAGAPGCNDDTSDLDADGTTDSDSDGDVDADGGDSDGGDSDGGDSDADGVADADAPVDDYEGDAAGECSDGVDNDRDGIFDCSDPGCSDSPECSTDDTGAAADSDGLPPLDGDDVDGSSSCDDEEASEEASEEAGEGEMVIKGWVTLSGDVDISSASCKITTWPWEAIRDGVPDFSSGFGMLGDACIDCPGVPDIAVPFTVVLPVAGDGEEVGVIAKVEADGRIYEEGTSANPLMSTSAGDAEGFVFTVEIAEPGPDDPGVDGGVGDLDPLDSGPDEPPDVDGGG